MLRFYFKKRSKNCKTLKTLKNVTRI